MTSRKPQFHGITNICIVDNLMGSFRININVRSDKSKYRAEIITNQMYSLYPFIRHNAYVPVNLRGTGKLLLFYSANYDNTCILHFKK